MSTQPGPTKTSHKLRTAITVLVAFLAITAATTAYISPSEASRNS
jgi:hypothetical protein